MGTRRVKRGSSNIDWIETHCRIPEGTFVGQPVRLRSWQRKIIKGIYDTPTRRAIISFGRKNAKTTLSAFLLLLHLCGPEARRNSQLFSAAQSREQAAILFALAAKIVRMSPDISGAVGVRDSSKQLYCEELGTIYRALSAEASTAFGLSPVFVVHDELGQVKGPRSTLYEALETASGAQDSPLSIVISTQAPTDADLLSLLIDDAAAGHDPETKLFMWSTPTDVADPFSIKALKAANPALGDFLNEKVVREQAEAARRMPAREAAFRNLILNQRVNQRSPFVAPGVWKACAAEPLEEAFRSSPVRVALDLSTRNDLTSLTMTAEYEGEHHVRAEFFAPEDGIADRAMRDRAPYDLWAQQGFITTTPGRTVDYEIVGRRLCEICDEYQVESIAFDRWRIDILKKELERMGVELPLVPFGQGFKDMSPALDALEAELLNRRIRHGGHPVLTICSAKAVVDADAAGNRKLNKAKSTGRIDGMVTLAMTMNTKVEADAYVAGSFRAV